MDIVYPSGGSGYTGPIPEPATVTVTMDDMPAPQVPSELPDPAPGPLTPAAALGFDGQAQTPVLDGSEEKPPDTHCAVGTGAGSAGRIVEVTNNGITIFDKTGSTVASSIDLDAFVPTTTTKGAFDPKVIFDQHSSRFFVVVLDGNLPNSGGSGGESRLHIAQSKTATPGGFTGADWNFHVADTLVEFPGDGAGPGPSSGYESWFDYPGIGADSTRLVITGNMFDSGGTGRGTKIRVYDKSTIGTTNTFTDFDVDAVATTGISTVQPAHTYGTTDNGNFYMINRFGSTLYRLWEIGGTAASPTLVAGTHTTTRSWTAGTQIAAGAPQSGVTGITISTLSSRVMNAVYRGGSVWCTLSADTDSDSKTEVVWFEINTNGGNPTAPSVAQSGSINGSDSDEWTFMPSINVNTNDDVAVCFSQSFSDQFVDIRVATRTSGETAGTMQTSVVYKTSVGEYDDFNSTNPERWGDYSACVVDPDDDTTFWIANEYCSVARSSGDDAAWGTWIAKLGTVVPVELSVFTAE
ncbi:MAG: hypothetical protein AMXMBFR84_33700 [Candidatus Hydrogenedentota bacterium]